MSEDSTQAEHVARALDKPVPWSRRLVAGSFLPVGLLLLWGANSFPELVEEHYSAGVFPLAREGLRAMTAFSTLPLAELLGVCIAGWFGLDLVAGLVNALRGQRSMRNLLGHGVSRGLSIAGTLYAFFLISWGMNYARAPYAQHANLQLVPVQAADLERLLGDLIERCNALRMEFEPDAFALQPAAGGVDLRVARGYERLAERIPALRSGEPILRLAVMSPVLSVLGISGIYSPFTAEAHLNDRIVAWLQPFVSAHEIAHFKGFAREDEANFIAWQVCDASGDPAVRYSGNLVALLHVASSLASVEPQQAEVLLASLSRPVLADVEQNREFWASKRSRVTAVALATNDAYLKSQGQADGRESYGRMVDLLVAQWNAERPANGGE